MYQGCISLGQVRCDSCHRLIPSSERYLAISEKKSPEAEKAHTFRYCADCCLKKGLAHYREEKGEQILTFFEGSNG
jgi:hypothetical protein